MNFLLFLGPIIGVAVAIFAVVVIIAVIGAVAGSGTANLYQYSVSRAVVRQLCLILSEDLISIQVVI